MGSTLLFAVIAPAAYALFGAPLALRISKDRPHRFVLPLGCCVAAVLAELALITGLSAPVVVGVGALGCVLGSMKEAGALIRAPGAIAELSIAWAVCLAAVAFSPFPILGSWSGDWLLALDAGRAVLTSAFTAEHLARPPLFGAAMAPLHMLSSGLPALQLMAAAASAGAALSVLELTQSITGRRPPPAFLLPFVLSAFFLHHTAASWSKLLSAAFIALSWALLLGDERRNRWIAALVFAMSVATHDGCIVWAPLAVLLAARGRTIKAWLTEGARFAGAIAVVAGPFLAWTLFKFGLAARVAANPALSDRSPDPFLLKSAGVIASSIVGWSPVQVTFRWLSTPQPFSGAVMGRELYWLVTAVVTVLAATLLGVVLPWFVTRGREPLRQVLDPLGPRKPEWLIGVAIATLATAALSPFYSPDGSLQVMHAPFVLGLFALLLASTTDDVVRRWTVATFILGTLPWSALNLAVSAGLRFSASFAQRFAAGSEGDYQRVLTNDLHPAGLDAFPWFALLAVAALVFCFRRFRVEQAPG